MPRYSTPWTGEAQDWYERWLDRLVEELKKYHPKRPDGTFADERAFSDEELPLMRAWYATQPRRFCTWVEPLGRDFSPGESYNTYTADAFWWEQPHWHLNWDALLEARGEARAAAQQTIGRAREAERYPTLDAWLAAACNGKIPVGGQYEPQFGFDWIPQEAYGHSLLETREQQGRLLQFQRNLWRWPLLCRECGQEFRPDRRKARRCPACRAKARIERTKEEAVG